jgi:formylglycine-generating enzyme required for sulfatase activity
MFAPLVWRLPLDRLKALSEAIGAPAPPRAQAGLPAQWATRMRDHVEDPRSLRAYLTADDLRIIGESYIFEKKEAWEAKNPGESFDEMVCVRVFEETAVVAPEAPKVRTTATRDPAGAADWPELASEKAWHATKDKAAVARELAASLGGFVSREPARDMKLARIEHRASGVTFVAIPGGTFAMGLSPAEKKRLAPIAKKLGEEATMHLRALGKVASPARDVEVPAFLCAEAPLTKKQAPIAEGESAVDVTPVHGVLLVDGDGAAKLAAKTEGRLLTEAEWEYVARAGSGRTWLSGATEAKAFVRTFLARELLDCDDTFGVHGLAWGTWVDDGWFDSYGRASADGSAREPRARPEVMRGGGAPMLVPWQVGGEAMLLLVAHREKRQKGNAPVLLARDLPKRRLARHS